MQKLLAQVSETLRRRGLLARGEGVLVAVSGGVDSLVLMHVLHTLLLRSGGRLVVAHFDHGLRGAQSRADARLVQRAAQKLGCECRVERGDVRSLAQARGWSIEMAARALRHEFLARMALRCELSTVALAQHADDQVELFFLRLFRGAGSGLAGMKWRAPSPADARVTLIRPLLDRTKEELRAVAQSAGIRFREDATNASLEVLRNRIRHELLPLLRAHYQPGLNHTVTRTMEIVAAESEWGTATAATWRAKPRRTGFLKLPVAWQRHCLCQELAAMGIAPEFKLVEQLRLQPGVRHSYQSAWIRSDGVSGRVELIPAKLSAGPTMEPVTIPLQEAGGTVKIAGVEFSWKRALATEVSGRNMAGRERFDAEVVGPNLVLRHWRAGDRFQPLGMPNLVKLQNLLTNAKIPVARRHELLLAEDSSGTIIWVEGLRIGECAKQISTTRTVLIWKWRRT